ncbi:MAG: adenylate/guanylate cyclase domain-containing protein [Spirochaetota bacterium]
MRIASRIGAICLPLLVAPLVFVGFTSWFAARDGITAIARDLLTFKTQELLRFTATQYDLLEANDLAQAEEFRTAAFGAVSDYADSLVQRESELLLSVNGLGELVFATGEVPAPDAARIASSPPGEGWQRLEIAGVPRVGVVTRFEPFDWTMIVSEAEETFFAPVTRISRQATFAVGISVFAMLVVIVVVSRLITRPLKETVGAMRGVIADGDMSRRVVARLNDETGELADSFNYMIRSLESAYADMKRFALSAAYSERREAKVRTVFQRYVPNHVITQFFEAPESMLVGEERPLSVLYSDIRGFTSFSEQLSSSAVVESLNQYFSRMVEVIDDNGGIVDKYIGDAIMAFFGAPVPNERSAHDAVLAAFDMLEMLDEFNGWQEKRGRARFRIGIAINHGPVTIGNIGSERKMDYTVIGDMVNVASRLEGLTKVYQQELLVTESVRRHIRGHFPVRMVDRVQVKGRERGLAVWTVKPAITKTEERGWKLYHSALLHYYNREFDTARGELRAAAELLPGDPLCKLFTERVERCLADPPPSTWTGLVKFDTK